MNNTIMENTTVKKKRGRKPKNKEIINENPVFDNVNTCEGFGITFRLKNPYSKLLKEYITFFKSGSN